MAIGFRNILELMGIWLCKSLVVVSSIHFFANDKNSSFFSGYNNSSFFADDKKSSFQLGFKRSSFVGKQVKNNG